MLYYVNISDNYALLCKYIKELHFTMQIYQITMLYYANISNNYALLCKSIK